MRNVLITGAGPKSFIGRNLKEAFVDKYNVLAPSHMELEILDYDALERYVIENKIDAIIHAAIHVPMFNGQEKEFFNDMKMFINIEKISHRVDKVLYFGSGAEFDKRFDILNVREENVGDSIPISEYGLAKYTMNKIAQGSNNIYNLRLFGIFGKYELWQIKFISNLCCKAIFSLPLTIRKDCYFDFLYIEDLPHIVEWFLENKPQYHDYNVCSGKHYLLSELAAIVNQVSKKNLAIIFLSDERNLDYSASNLRLTEEMTNLKITEMEDAIKNLYHYYEREKSKIDYEVLKKSL